MSHQTKFKIFFAALVMTFILYGRSLNYGFVYDDQWRIERNESVKNLINPIQFFFNPATQAGTDLHGHTFRPLPTFVNAIEYKLWGPNPAYYRIINFLLHALNTTLAIVISTEVFMIPLIGSIIGGIFFLVHPLQVESVVWVSEFSNLFATHLLLLGLLFWNRFAKQKKISQIIITYSLFIISLLTRETAVCFGPMIFLHDLFLTSPRNIKKNIQHYSTFFILTLFYMWIRSQMLGRVGQASLWGGTLATHIANVFSTFLLYPKLMLFPTNLRIMYSSLPIATSFYNHSTILGALLFIILVSVILFNWKSHPAISLSIALFLLFWIPGSNIIPLNTLFAERLSYPMMSSCIWIIGLTWVFLSEHFQNVNWKTLTTLISIFLLSFTIITIRQIPVWKDEETLWKNAVYYEPQSWFAWACLANAQVLKQRTYFPEVNSAEAKSYLEKAETYYLNALDNKPYDQSKGRIFICLAGVQLDLGKNVLGNENAQKALFFQPSLKEEWEKMLVEKNIKAAVPEKQ